jgi:RimJ/RimL family protein N-acetyltransferase
MEGELIECRISDAEILYRWANDSEVRQNAFNQNEIEWPDHLEWLSKKLNSAHTLQYILKSEGNFVGQIRFDLDENGDWIIDYSIDKNYRGLGFGKYIIRLGLEKVKSTSRSVIARVKPENQASIHVFSTMGFEKINNNKEYISFRLAKI